MDLEPMLRFEDFTVHRLTVDQVIGMVEAGVIDPDARVELIEGVLVDMPPKGNPHEWLKRKLLNALFSSKPDHLDIAVESSLILDDESYCDPDLLIFDGSYLTRSVRGRDAVMLVEISDSSLAYDLKVKAALYARHDVALYWVIDAVGEAVYVHTEPSPEGYRRIEQLSYHDTLALPWNGPDGAALTLKVNALI